MDRGAWQATVCAVSRVGRDLAAAAIASEVACMMVKNPLADAGDARWIPGSGRSPRVENGNPLQYSFLGNPVEKRSLVGYSLWGRKESDMTEQLSMHAH